mgnify:CR=1 FL=1
MDNLMKLRFDKSFLLTLFVGILAFTTVVTVRSYSRNSGETSWELDTSTPRAVRVAATACS